MPEFYDPIVRQEPFHEPQQYTHMTPEHYQHLSKVLTKSTSLSPPTEGNFISPPPSQQTEEIIRLLIDLFESQKNIKEYRGANTFDNPRDWMFVISNDISANRINLNQFAEILPINEVEKRMQELQKRPNQPVVIPPRRPDPRYQFVDRMSQLYNFKSAKMPLPQLVEPLYRFLEWQAQQELNAEKARHKLQKDLAKITLPSIPTQPLTELPRRQRDSNHTSPLLLEGDLLDTEMLFEKYKALLSCQ